MDAAYWPDQTWFRGLIDKTVLILADGSLPAASDEVLIRGKYDCVINSIRNYAGNAILSIKPLMSKVIRFRISVGVMVVNWSALRHGLAQRMPSKLAFSVGRGAFYLAAEQRWEGADAGVPATTLISSTTRWPGAGRPR